MNISWLDELGERRREKEIQFEVMEDGDGKNTRFGWLLNMALTILVVYIHR